MFLSHAAYSKASGHSEAGTAVVLSSEVLLAVMTFATADTCLSPLRQYLDRRARAPAEVLPQYLSRCHHLYGWGCVRDFNSWK